MSTPSAPSVRWSCTIRRRQNLGLMVGTLPIWRKPATVFSGPMPYRLLLARLSMEFLPVSCRTGYSYPPRSQHLADAKKQNEQRQPWSSCPTGRGPSDRSLMTTMKRVKRKAGCGVGNFTHRPWLSRFSNSCHRIPTEGGPSAVLGEQMSLFLTGIIDGISHLHYGRDFSSCGASLI